MKVEAKKTVLIVENNEHLMWTLQAVLEDAGVNARATWSGHEALELLKSEAFDALVLDDYLPDLHSTEFLRRVGRLPLQPWIVVMRNSAPTAQYLRDYVSLGAFAVVGKDPDEVRKAVLSCCAEGPLAKILVN